MALALPRPGFVTRAVCSAWIEFRVAYSQTLLGVAWPLVSASVFVLILGSFFSLVMHHPIREFMPHIAWGYAIWSVINSSVTAASGLVQSQKQAFLAGQTQLLDSIARSTARSFIEFGFQAIPALAVTLLLEPSLGQASLWVIPGLTLLLIHAVWVRVAIGLLIARFPDLRQLVPIIMRVGFLVTPIIWMADSQRAEILGLLLYFNPFFHALEPLRDALLNQQPDLASLAISGALATLGALVALFAYGRFGRRAILWI